MVCQPQSVRVSDGSGVQHGQTFGSVGERTAQCLASWSSSTASGSCSMMWTVLVRQVE